MLVDDMFKTRSCTSLGTRFGGAQLLIQQAYSGHERARQGWIRFLVLGLDSQPGGHAHSADHPGRRIVGAWPDGVSVARQVIMREALPATRRHLRIEISQLQNLAGVLGGGALVDCGGRP
jgi:hypothetical protein